MKLILIIGIIALCIYSVIVFDVLAQDEEGFVAAEYVFDVAAPEFTIQKVAAPDKNTYLKYSFEKAQFLSEEGKPQLPSGVVRVAVPQGSRSIQVEVIDASTEDEVLAYPIYPTPKHILQQERNSPAKYFKEQFTIDRKSYASADVLPTEKAQIIEQGKMRELQYVAVGINYLQYSPSQNTLTINKNLKVRVSWIGPVDADPAVKAAAFKEIARGMLNIGLSQGEPLHDRGSVTYLSAGQLDDITNQVDYLIIVCPQLYADPHLGELANHRAAYNNFNVAVVKTTDIYAAVGNTIPLYEGLIIDTHGGNDLALDVKRFLYYAYNNWDNGAQSLEQVLLVGDEYPDNQALFHLPAYIAVPYKHIATDYWYTCLNDDYPDGVINEMDRSGDLLIGRFAVRDTYSLANIVNKTIAYELYPPQPPMEEWGTKALLTSGFAEGDIPNHMPDVRDDFVLPNRLQVSEMYVANYNDDYAAIDAMKDLINQGHGLMLHNGHGWSHGWQIGGSGHNFMNTDVFYLENGNMVPVVYSLSCSTAEFDNQWGCLGESFTNVGGKGAIAFLGASRDHSPSEGSFLLDGFMDAMLNGGDYILGSSFLQGKINLAYSYWDARYLYNILGDPALDLEPTIQESLKPELFCEFISFAERQTTIEFNSRISNIGNGDAQTVCLRLYEGDPQDGGVEIPFKPNVIDVAGTSDVEFQFQIRKPGGWEVGEQIELYLTVDYIDIIDELCETNNVSERLELCIQSVPTNLISSGSFPATYGNKIVWQDDPDTQGKYDIFLYDLGPDGLFSTSDDLGVFRITNDEDQQMHPDIYADKIVWRKAWGYNNASIQMYNLGADGIFGTPDDSGPVDIATLSDYENLTFPQITTNFIVWDSYIGSGNRDIFYYNISQQQQVHLTWQTSMQRMPKVSGDKIVWMDYRNGNYEIYLYDVSDGVEIRLTNNSYQQQYPAISGRYVSWQDNRNSNEDIYLLNIDQQSEPIRVTNNSSHQRSPVMFASTIIWEDERNDNIDVYSCTTIGFNPSVVQMTVTSENDRWPDFYIGRNGKNLVYYSNGNIYFMQFPNQQGMGNM
jgi:beta propeller repeat protein